MLVKKSPATAITAAVLPIRGFDRQLQDLYARRSAIESLIRSLEEYECSRVKRLELRKRKTA
jgi:hypothetical protein